MSDAPLHDVRVLDLTRLLPGPVCTMHLADLGAEVIKIEDCDAGDYAPPALRAVVNRNKRGLRLDLKQAQGAQLFLRLAQSADVVVESFRPGVMERLGVGYEAVARLNPAIVYCSISGYGQTGPLRDLAGHDLNYCAQAGVADQIGCSAEALALSNVPLADLLGGALNAAMGILAALYDARRSGLGRHVDIAMADGVLAHAIMPLVSLNASGHTRPAGGDTLSGALPCYAVYATADGRQLAVAALEKKFWDRFCDVIGRPELKPAHRSADAAVAQRVRRDIAALIASRPLAHWQEQFAGSDCCVSPVLKLEESVAHEHFQARGMVQHSEHPRYGTALQLGCPVHMSGFDFAIRRLAPVPGEHSEQILRELGLSAAEIGMLMAAGTIA